MRYHLETKRLNLYPFQTTDLDVIHQTFTNSFVRKFLWDNEIITIEQSKDILLRNAQTFKENNWGLWKVVVKADNSYAGFVGLWIFFDEKRPQLIYGLLPDRTKYGYALEASRQILNYAFDSLKYDYLIATCDTPNADSIKVCERLGMNCFKTEMINNKMTSFFRIDRSA